MKNKMFTFTQSCDSRECRKKFKSQLSDMCEAVTTVHTLDRMTKTVTCTQCNKSYKLLEKI